MHKILRNKKAIGFILVIIIAAVMWNMNIKDISSHGQKALILTLVTVTFWAMGISDVGFTSLLYLTSLLLLNIAPAWEIFSIWSSHTIYLVIGAYLIADAVNRSGLGERIAYMFILKFVSSFNSIIVSTFVLQVILSLLIPHPWPRAFLVLSVMKVVIKSTGIAKEDASIIGLSVFAAAIPTVMFFLTGESNVNMLAVELSGQDIGWLKWLYYMGIPALVASTLTCFLIIKLFKPSGQVSIDENIIKEKLDNLGSLTSMEKRTIFWVSVAIILWATDFIHGIELGWVTILIVVMMSMPLIGEVLSNDSWRIIPIDTLLFLNAALSISKVGKITDMNSWIASTILPSTTPESTLIILLLVTIVSLGLHMVLGSVMATMGIAIPALLAYTSATNINPTVVSLLVYTAASFHYILPYHRTTILIGIGEKNGMYDESHIMKLGIPLTLAVFITILLVQIPWWYIIGLL